MHIEYYVPLGHVKGWLLNFVRDKLLELHHLDKEISAAKVIFRKDDGNEENLICEIEVTIYSDSFFERRDAGSYEQAARDVLAVLDEKIGDRVAKLNELPDEITSTEAVS